MGKSPAEPRKVAVSIIMSMEATTPGTEPSFLLVSSRKHKDKWVLPKGGIEKGENAREAAEREAWEEAGLIAGKAQHLDHLITLSDPQAHKSSPTTDPTSENFIPYTTYAFELFSLSSRLSCTDSNPHKPTSDEKEDPSVGLANDWPEKSERERKWVKGWTALENAVSWGRREDTMLSAVKLARQRFLEER